VVREVIRAAQGTGRAIAAITLVSFGMAVLMALVPLIFAGLTTVGFMIAMDIRFNPINSIAIPLLDGIAVDAGVFLVSVVRQARAEGLDRSDPRAI
jgi:predicted RND superfamily exporter protein